MNDMHTEVVSAFCDGEPVAPDALERALADPDARRLLVDCVRLRTALRRTDDMLPASLASLRRPQRSWRAVAVPLPIAAALMLVVALASYFLPRTQNPSISVLPPAPARVVHFEPGVDWQQAR